jgi:hypothetical protein
VRDEVAAGVDDAMFCGCPISRAVSSPAGDALSSIRTFGESVRQLAEVPLEPGGVR